MFDRLQDVKLIIGLNSRAEIGPQSPTWMHCWHCVCRILLVNFIGERSRKHYKRLFDKGQLRTQPLHPEIYQPHKQLEWLRNHLKFLSWRRWWRRLCSTCWRNRSRKWIKLPTHTREHAKSPKSIVCSIHLHVWLSSWSCWIPLGFTAKDLGTLTQKYWDLHRNIISGADSAAFTVLTVHYNLACGTLVPHAERRPELQPLLKQVLDFDVV